MKEGKGMSKIAALAKARAEKKAMEAKKESDSNETSSTSILDKLKSKQISNGSSSTSSSLSTPQSSSISNSASKLSSLSSFSKSTLGRRPLPKLRRSKVETTTSTEPTTSKPESIPTNQQKEKQEKQENIPPSKDEPSFIYLDVTFKESPFLPSLSNSKIAPLFLHPNRTKLNSGYKRKLDEFNLTSVYLPNANSSIAKKVKTNFSKPSPDDIVLTAQKQAFEDNHKQKKKDEETISKGVSTLKITPKQATKPKTKIDLDAELSKRQTKPHTSFVVIGHVDAGKSTLTGRLLLENNIVDKNTYTKLKREADKAGKSSFSLAWVMDQTQEERNRGVTIDICTSEFETENGYFTIVDAPGHRDFVPNMITGVSQADIAVLVVDSSTDAFESGFNLDGQTKEHTILARSLGINKFVVAVNKMDNNDWSQDRFEEIQAQLLEFLKITGFQEDQCQFVPCSGLTGLNVASKPSTIDDERKLKWYNGDSVLGALEKSERFSRDFTKPFVMSVADIASNNEFTGRIDTGTIQPGETVLFAPSNQAGIVDSVTVNNSKVAIGIAGDNVTLKIKDVMADDIQVGDVISIVTTEIPSVSKFESRLVLFDLKRPLLLGTQFVLFRGNVQQPAKITKVISLLDKVTGQVTKKKPKHLSSHQSAMVEIELLGRQLPLQLFKDNKQLGRIVLRKDGATIGAGIVEKY